MAIVDLLSRNISQTLTAPLVVVMPIYNEEATIESVVEEWRRMLGSLEIPFQMILLNDGSRDQTLQKLQALEARCPREIVVVNKSNSGHGLTCRTGYEAAIQAGAVEWVFQIDSDGQCDPASFPEFWQKREEADCVFGRRTQRDDGALRVLTSGVCRWSSSLLAGVDLADPNVPYRLMRKPALAAALAKVPVSFELQNIALTLVLKKTPGLRWLYIPIRFRDRQGGDSMYNLLNMMQKGFSMLVSLAKLRRRL